MQFLTPFLFFANNSRMEGPIPVFLTYLDLPNGLEGGSTANYYFLDFHAEQGLPLSEKLS